MPFKLYIDSRFRKDVGGSGNTDSDFSIELPHPIKVKGKAFCDVFMCPNTFLTVRTGENDRIYMRENGVDMVCVVAPGQYQAFSLQTAVQDALNANSVLVGSYHVNRDPIKNVLVMYNNDANLTSFNIFSSKYLKENPSAWTGSTLNLDNLMSIENVLGYGTTNQILTGGNQNNALEVPDAINTQAYNQLFLRSSLGLGYDAIGPDGSSDIIRRVVCQAAQNDMIVDMHSLPTDHITIGDRQISSLSFKLTDVHGRVVDTLGHPISFSIIFVEED